MSEETEQEIAKRIYRISTQIENIKATQLNTQQLTAVIRSANAQVRHIQRQKDELSQDEFLKMCENVKDTADKLDYWESRYKLVLDIIEEWDKDFLKLKADFERLSEAGGRTDKDAEFWKQKSIDINNDYIYQTKALEESNHQLNSLRSDYADLQARYDELDDDLKMTRAECDFYKQESNKHADELMHMHDKCNSRQVQIKELTTELENQKAEVERLTELSENAKRASDVHSHNFEKVNAECALWKKRYDELNKKYDNGAVKFTDAKLKADAIALSYEELSDKLQAAEQERDKYKEKYEVTKKLLDAEVGCVEKVDYQRAVTESIELEAQYHTLEQSYYAATEKNKQLEQELSSKDQQIDGVFKEAKLLTETKTQLVSELLDLKYMIHRIRIQDETPDGCLPVEIAAALPERRVTEITAYNEVQAKTELAKLQIQFDDLIADYHKLQQQCGTVKSDCSGTETEIEEGDYCAD
jgi:chromosome segregation ATPase